MTAAAPCLGKARGRVTVWLTRHVICMTSNLFSFKYMARVLRKITIRRYTPIDDTNYIAENYEA